MGIVKFGGFVFTIDGGNYVGTSKKGIDKDTFKKVAKALGIPKADIDQLIDHHPRSIHIYSGTNKPPFTAVAGSKGGSGGGGGGKGGGGGGKGGSGGE
jgi:hypothetical protein